MGLPVADVAAAYAKIQADERRHHNEGRDFVSWLLSSGSVLRADAGDVHNSSGSTVPDATPLAWDWTEPSAAATAAPVPDANCAKELCRIMRAGQRGGGGMSMEWSWSEPETVQASSGMADMRDLLAHAHEQAGSATAMEWSWRDPEQHAKQSEQPASIERS